MKCSGGSFNDEQLKILQSALDQACRELGISPADKEEQTRVAEAVMAPSKAGQLDVDQLTKYAVYNYRFPAR
jgi:hypothetical protein